ncbi:hypothetical protein ACXC9Q_02865 [Kribbella sp. CWNU-51]
MLQQEPRAGYALGTSAPGRNGSKALPDAPKDLAYIALSSVTKAARSYARTLDEDPARTTIAILFPVIVIRGKLFETWFDGEDLVWREGGMLLMAIAAGSCGFHQGHPAGAVAGFMTGPAPDLTG